MEAETVFLGEDGGGAEAQFVGGAQDADRNFAPVEGRGVSA